MTSRRDDVHPLPEHAFLDAEADQPMMVLSMGGRQRYHVRPHSHAFFELLFLLEGRRAMRIDDGSTFVAERGDLVIFHPETRHEEWWASESISLFGLRFSAASLHRLGVSFPDRERCGPVVHLPYERRFRELLQQMFQEYRQPGINSQLLLSAYMVEFIILLQRALAEVETHTTRRPEERIRQVAEAIAADPARMGDISSLAALVDMSAGHFSKRFKQVVGVPPREYLIEQRIERAKALLDTTNASAQEIAAQLGYEDPYFFYRQFKERTGMTTSDWRARGNPSLDHR